MDSFKLLFILTKAKSKDKVKLYTNSKILNYLLKDKLVTPTFTSDSDDYDYYELTSEGFWKKVHLEHWMFTTTIAFVALFISIFALFKP